jgi:hypothetical protein
LAPAGCGGNKSGVPATPAKSAPDARLLVVQPSDLPSGFRLLPAESFPLPLATVLADPWSVGAKTAISRQRLSGYQNAFLSPELERLQCNAGVYRSAAGATAIFSLTARNFAAFVTASGGRSWRPRKIGAESRAFRLNLGPSKGFAVAWRFRNVLSTCTSLGPTPSNSRQTLRLARAQQGRIATAVGKGVGR